MRTREVVQTRVCVECNLPRASRFRKVIAIEREATPGTSRTIDLSLRKLARILSRLFADRDELRGGPLLRRLGGVRAEADLESLASCAPLRLVYRRDAGSLQLRALQILNRAEFTELAYPGEASRRATALVAARQQLGPLSHPEAKRILDLLATPDERWDSRVVMCLAALARLVDRGDVVPARGFAAEVLGDSKALSSMRARLERIAGPLDRLGIRDAGAVILLGGSGTLYLPDREMRLDGLCYVGIAPHDVERLTDIHVPADGVLVIENLTPFHACLDALGSSASVMLVWAGGFPSRGVVKLLRLLSTRAPRVRIWCDLDLGGIRIARLLHRLAPEVSHPVLMAADDIQTSSRRIAISPEQRTAMRRDLALHPAALLAPTLAALIEHGVWVEQETLLHRIPELI